MDLGLITNELWFNKPFLGQVSIRSIKISGSSFNPAVVFVEIAIVETCELLFHCHRHRSRVSSPLSQVQIRRFVLLFHRLRYSNWQSRRLLFGIEYQLTIEALSFQSQFQFGVPAYSHQLSTSLLKPQGSDSPTPANSPQLLHSVASSSGRLLLSPAETAPAELPLESTNPLKQHLLRQPP